MKKKYVLPLAAILVGLFMQSCGTVFASRITCEQVTKPGYKEPKRNAREGILVADIICGLPFGGVGVFVFLWIDHQSGALYKKAPAANK